MVEVRYASLCWFTDKCFIDGQVLLEHGAEVNAVHEDGWTALHAAAHYGDAEMVKVRYAFTLLVHWQILYRRPGSSRARSRRRLNRRRWMDCFALCSPLWRRRNGQGPLRIHFVGSLAHTVSIDGQVILEHGADVDSTTDDGWTVLQFAARYGDAEMVKVRYASLCWFTGKYFIDGQVLLEHGAEVNAVHEDGWTALHAAAHYGDAEMVKVRYASLCWFTGTYCIDGQVLLEHGADVDSTDDDGWTALHFAAHDGDAEIVEVRYASLCWFTGTYCIDRRPGYSRAWSRRRLNHRRWMDCSALRSPLRAR